MSSFLSANPEAFSAAAQDLSGIGSAIRSANTAAAASTTQVAAAAQDEVSTAIAGLFGSYAQDYQALIAQAGQFHAQFVHALTSGAAAYTATEAANVNPLGNPATAAANQGAALPAKGGTGGYLTQVERDAILALYKQKFTAASNWVKNAAVDVKDWTRNAVEDAGDGNWWENAYADTKDWTRNAAEDVGDWVGTAATDTLGAVKWFATGIARVHSWFV